MEFSDDLGVLSCCRLFYHVNEQDIEPLLQSLGARMLLRPAGSFFVMQQTRTEDVNILVYGRCVGERVSGDGSLAVVNEFGPGDVFGDVLSGSSALSQVGVRAVTDCRAVCFTFSRLLAADTALPAVRALVLRNLIAHISEKYFALKSRLAIVLTGTIRQRILDYLQQFAGEGEGLFTVAHNREEMAAYLGCERSALSRELSQMRREGLITYHHNQFQLLNRDRDAK